MEFFPDGGFVRLQCREYGTYLHADEDGVSLTLRSERASLNAAWRVHQIVRNNITYVLLYGAAYGRYLKSTKKRGPLGVRGQRVVQGFYDEPDDNAVVWVAARVEAGGNLIFLRQVSGNRVLRANGKHFKWMRTGVSVDSYFNRSTMMHWLVEIIPPLPAVPIFPPPPPPPPAVPAPAPVHPKRGIFCLFRRRTRPVRCRRTIRFMRADNAGNFNDQGWRMFQFEGRSAYELRMAMTRQTNEHFYFFYVTLCAWGGRCGRMTPLTADLPRCQERMDVVGLSVGSPAEEALWYPNVDAP